MSADDRRWMATALALGTRGQGRVWPNPAVGCVLVRDGRIVGRGWTQPGGAPHAEAEALARAGPAARGATAYVTLEPCANWGRTPPCADALIGSGVGRVVVGCIDPDPRVDGRGLRRLRAAGVEVVLGCAAAACLRAHLGLYRRIRAGRPMVTLKLATSLDGRIATAGGDSRWITGAAARAWGHALRAGHDAILIGSGTALADDPLLTCRLPGLERRSPVRVVLDRRLRLRPASRLARSARDVPLWLVTEAAPTGPAAAELRGRGVEILHLAPGAGIGGALAALAARGITRLLVEGGGTIAAALVGAGLVDRVQLFIAAMVLGGDARPALAGLGLERVAEAPRYEVVDELVLGADRMIVMEPPRLLEELGCSPGS
jgi:diaminohydroxyphosphoribosylaminopyrimidine deaminase/5-amino-6-(5-phosphoribosylamino)uracil reductase